MRFIKHFHFSSSQNAICHWVNSSMFLTAILYSVFVLALLSIIPKFICHSTCLNFFSYVIVKSGNCQSWPARGMIIFYERCDFWLIFSFIIWGQHWYFATLNLMCLYEFGSLKFRFWAFKSINYLYLGTFSIFAVNFALVAWFFLVLQDYL